MNSLLYHERYREAHETLDFIEDTISHQLLSIPQKHKDRLAQEHYVAFLLEAAQDTSNKLLSFYEDLEGTKKEESETVLQASNALDMSSFYQQLQSIRQYYRSEDQSSAIGNSLAIPLSQVISVQPKHSLDLDVLFSGEEAFGKYLDLNALYRLYCNLKAAPPLDYLTFIELLDKFDGIPFVTKLTTAYSDYLQEVINYLVDFLKRAKPLYRTVDFITQGKSANPDHLAAKNIIKDAENQDDPLFCKPCQKLFSKDTVYQAHFTGKKHIKAVATLQGSKVIPGVAIISKLSKEEKIASLNEREGTIRSLYKVLRPIKDSTIANLERKQSRTAEELLEEENGEEWDEGQVLIDSTNDDTERETDRLYNPLKLPLGWDGKPIPYWLYKLHGLSVSYTCEICGNYVYMGRKAFEKHFQEWRHAQGMKCLGLPNTKHFQEITTIQDALLLAEKLKLEAKKEVFKRDTMEEFEDSEGNIFNRKTFEDLHRQGLI